ncbi:hypothetical protein Celaphus_00016860 [Cervus elaphus hippelaphus]|uniref:Uncharacterized protein n=1 Tax=Cervus elaphus hippelaphus TaxID=46360 RepID=A0A212C4L4_CEREH|nr:hypothetical protein Celaphus_00016860 [Cervus elaphus hippelaphus]
MMTNQYFPNYQDFGVFWLAWFGFFCSTQSPLSSRGKLVSPQVLVGEGQTDTELPTAGSEVPAPVTLKGPLSPHKERRRNTRLQGGGWGETERPPSSQRLLPGGSLSRVRAPALHQPPMQERPPPGPRAQDAAQSPWLPTVFASSTCLQGQGLLPHWLWEHLQPTF